MAITVVLMFFTDPVLNLFLRIIEPDDYVLVRKLFLWMMPSAIVLVLSTWMSGLLNVNGKFNLSSFAVLIYNVAFVGIAVVLTRSYGPESYGIGAFFAAALNGCFLIYRT